MPSPIFSQLPDLCLLALFRQLPPADQLTVRFVCYRWFYLLPQVTRSREKLVILLGDGQLDVFERWINWYYNSRRCLALLRHPDFAAERITPWNSLQRPELNPILIRHLGEVFPNLKKLLVADRTIGVRLSKSLPNLAQLLRQSSSQQLTSLKILGDYLHSPASKQFCAALNRLPVLKSLHLSMLFLAIDDLPIITKLEELTINSQEISTAEFALMLERYAGDSLQRVAFANGLQGRGQLVPFLRLREDLRNRFISIDFRVANGDLKGYSKFSRLTSLNIFLSSTTFRRLFTSLAALKELVYLRLKIEFRSILVDDGNEDNLLLPQAHSIKALELILLGMHRHQELEALHLPWTMPNLEVAYYDFWYSCQCTNCGVVSFTEDQIQKWPGPARRCLCTLFAPLKSGCLQLHSILHNREKVLGTAEQLMAE